jgi:hypothetical protein
MPRAYEIPSVRLALHFWGEHPPPLRRSWWGAFWHRLDRVFEGYFCSCPDCHGWF